MKTEMILPSYRLEKINLYEKGHIEFIDVFNCDQECSQYLGNLFRVFEKEAPPSYIVHLGNTQIGFLQIETVNFETRELTYALHPRCRHHGYASGFVREASDFLLNEECEQLLLKIAKNNLSSIRVAINAGFSFEPIDDYRYYEFVKRKK